jgi:hypothetical protein
MSDPASRHPAGNRVFVVLGMHRSGTSLVARALSALGVELGDNLWGPRDDNPTGFWEDRDVVALDEQLLERAGVDWNLLVFPEAETWTGATFEDLKERAVELVRERLSRYGAWGFKDPRASRVLPFWKDVFATLGVEAGYLLTVRHPLDVAGSLGRRNELPRLHSHLLWLEHVCRSLTDTAGARRCFVDYDELVEQPAVQARRLAQALDIPVTPAIEEGIAAFAGGFVADGLRHHRTGAGAAHDDVPKPAIRLYALMRDLALGKGGDEALAGAVSEAQRALAGLRPVGEALDHAEGRIASARAGIIERDYWLGELRSQIEQLKAEKAEVEGIVRDHGARLVAMNAELTEVSQRLGQREAELSRIKRHWYWYIARLIIR